MLSRRLLRRLRQIDKGPKRPTDPVRESDERESTSPELVRTGMPELSRRRLAEQVRRSRESAPSSPASDSVAKPPTPGGPLEQLVPGECVTTEHGSCWRVTEPAHTMLPHGAEVLARFERLTRQLSDEPDGLRGVPLRRIALLDTETAGLSSAPIFLVGMIVWETDAADQALSVQLFARDYAEERAVLAEAAGLLTQRSVLLTYNGRSFDLPMMRERMVYHALGECPEPAVHLDLLHEVRSRFRGYWEDCRLQTLEKHLCGRRRVDDIDGAEIPQAWHDFVHTGDASLIARIIEHNRMDLMTMLEVLPYLYRDVPGSR